MHERHIINASIFWFRKTDYVEKEIIMPNNNNHRGDCCHAPTATDAPSRRGFLTLATLAAGAALLTPATVRRAEAAGGTDVMLLSCMDYRLMDDIAAYMQKRGLKNKYDHVILAGASLGAITTAEPEWGATFWDHVGVAKKLHHIKKIIVMDHRDCGAYKVFLNADVAGDPTQETALHAVQLRTLHDQIKAKHPDLAVELLLMDLKGKVEEITPA